MEIKGLITAAITPFLNGHIDIDSFEKFMLWQLHQGVKNIVLFGSTGEGLNLTETEKKQILEVAVKIKAQRNFNLIVGVGSASTMDTIHNAKIAEGFGVDALLAVSPYYNKPTQEGLYQHFKALNDEVKTPIILYNVPGRTVSNISDETIAKLASLHNITGLKDATGDLSRPTKLRSLLSDPGEFMLYSGEDITAHSFNAAGGQGVISVTSNIAPNLCLMVQRYSLEGQIHNAIEVQNKLVQLHNIMFCESNPIPVKYGVYLMGLIKSPEMRLPLTTLSISKQEELKQLMIKVKLLKNG